MENLLTTGILSVGVLGLALVAKTAPPLPEKITPYPVVANITNRILAFDFKSDGSLGPAATLHQFPSSSVDGIMFDEYDRLWVARWLNGTVDVITLDGKLVASVPAGGTKVTNLCFWGKSVYVTVAGSHAIHRLDAGVGGKPYTQ